MFCENVTFFFKEPGKIRPPERGGGAVIKKRSFKAQYDLFNDSEIDMIECKLRMMGCRVVHGGDGRTLGEQHCTPRPPGPLRTRASAHPGVPFFLDSWCIT